VKTLKTQNKERNPNLTLELKTLITKFNKLREEKLEVKESEVKQLARNFKALATRVEQMINEIKQDVMPHGILNNH
jgi:predicted  nucleic acid-binding Zn-ribbon protein